MNRFAHLIYVYIFLMLTFFGCTLPNTKRVIVSTYDEKATKLITTIFSKYNECGCAIASNESLLESMENETPARDNRTILKSILKIKSDFQLDSLDGISKGFELNQSMFIDNLKLIKSKDYDSILQHLGKKGIEELWWFECQQNIKYVSKPLFNRNLSEAAILIDDSFGCFPGRVSHYKLNQIDTMQNHLW